MLHFVNTSQNTFSHNFGAFMALPGLWDNLPTNQLAVSQAGQLAD